ncbi:MAG: hypothetical protein WDN46_10360 [Methylocella sp.]
MGISAISGPHLVYGGKNTLGAAAPNNPDAGPSMYFGGLGIIDPRVGYNVTTSGAVGWYGVNPTVVIDQIPSALTTTAIAAAQVPGAGVPLTLVGASGAGVTLMSAPQLVFGSGNTIAAGSLALDGLPGLVGIGLPLPSTGNSRMRWYDPTKALARNVRIASVGNDSGATFLVSGADLYGFPQTELITGANAGTASGHKSFKFIFSITPAGALSGANVSAGQGDVYGFPLQINSFFYTTIYYPGVQITSATGFTAADTTNPATSTTGDVRGTYALQTPSNGTNRLQVSVDLALALIATTPLSQGMFGVTPA